MTRRGLLRFLSGLVASVPFLRRAPRVEDPPYDDEATPKGVTADGHVTCDESEVVYRYGYVWVADPLTDRVSYGDGTVTVNGETFHL